MTAETPALTQYEIHPLALRFPPMTGKDFDDLVADIRDNKQREPIKLYEGKILDGRNRYTACLKLGREVWAEELDPEKLGDPKAYVRSMNIERRHLTAEQKRDLIAELLKENPEASNRQIAETVGVDDKTVAPVREDLERRAEIPHVETRTDTTGRQQPANKSSTTNKSAGGGSTAGAGKSKRDPVMAAIKKDPLRVLDLAFNSLCDTELAIFVSKWKSKYASTNQVFALIEEWDDIDLLLLIDEVKAHVAHRLLAKPAEPQAEAVADIAQVEAEA